MKLHSIAINKKADVKAIFGKKLAAAILKDCPGQISQAKPRCVTLYTEKPVYHLNDGETLSFYAIDFVEQTIIGRHYAGSSDTTYFHQGEQLADGGRAPGDAVIAVRHFWNGKNMSWMIDVISDNVRAMLPEGLNETGNKN